MRGLGDRCLAWMLGHSGWVLAVVVLGTAAVLPAVSGIRLDRRLDAFFDPTTEGNEAFRQWKEQFGQGREVIVAFSADDIFTEEALRRVSRLTEALETLPGVAEVTSLTTAKEIVGRGSDLIVRPLIESVPASEQALRELRQRTLRCGLFTHTLVSPDGTTAGIVVELEEAESADAEAETVAGIQRAVAAEAGDGSAVYLAGSPVAEREYALSIERDLRRMMPLVLGVIGAILLVTFRQPGPAVFPMAVIVVSLIHTLAWFRLCGFRMNSVTSMIPPIILAVAVADAVHIVAGAVRGEGDDRKRIVAEAVRRSFRPCGLTTLTTLVGFLSLMTSRSPAVRQMGIVAGGGVVIAFAVTFALLPALLIRARGLWRPGAGEGRRAARAVIFSDALFERIGRASAAHRGVWLLAVAVLLGVSVWGLTRIRIRTSLMAQLGEGSPVTRATRWIEARLGGTHVLHVSLQGAETDIFKAPAWLERIERLQASLAAIPEVDKTVSVVDHLKEMHRAFHDEDEAFDRVPETRAMVGQYLLMCDTSHLKRLVDSDWTWTTVSVRMKESDTARMAGIIAAARARAEELFAGPVVGRVLGETVRNTEGTRTVTAGQMSSLGVAMFTIFAMMFAVFRSFSIGLAAIVPNAVPLVIHFGVMGVFGIPLDPATSLISAIGLGVIVDDTIHFLDGFGRALGLTDDYEKAVVETLKARGRPIVYTSVILCCGFGVLTFSRFVPTVHFGMLSALLMVTALLADLFILPCVLMAWRPSFRAPRAVAAASRKDAGSGGARGALSGARFSLAGLWGRSGTGRLG